MSKKLKSCTLLVQQNGLVPTGVSPTDPIQGELFPEISLEQTARYRKIAEALAKLGRLSEVMNPQRDDLH